MNYSEPTEHDRRQMRRLLQYAKFLLLFGHLRRNFPSQK